MRVNRSALSFNRYVSNKQTRDDAEARMTDDEIRSNAEMTNMESKSGISAFGFWPFFIGSSTFVSALALASTSTLAESAPSAKQILESVRMVESRQQIDLQGQLRQDDVAVPFRLVENGPLISYSFKNPDET